MWTTVLIMAIAVIFEPIRLGLAVLMLNRRRPVLQLLAFLCGGFAMGIGVGLVMLFALRSTPLTGNFRVAQAQIVAGLLVLLVALVMTANVSARTSAGRSPAAATTEGDNRVALLDSPSTNFLKKLTQRTRQALRGDSLRVAWVSGLGTALPSANYLGAIAVILSSGAAPAMQAEALLVFNVVAFVLVEVPLVSYLAAPRKTRQFMTALQEWIQSRSHLGRAALIAAGGCFLLALGLSGL